MACKGSSPELIQSWVSNRHRLNLDSEFDDLISASTFVTILTNKTIFFYKQIIMYSSSESIIEQNLVLYHLLKTLIAPYLFVYLCYKLTRFDLVVDWTSLCHTIIYFPIGTQVHVPMLCCFLPPIPFFKQKQILYFYFIFLDSLYSSKSFKHTFICFICIYKIK